ncbi:MAG TPA: HAD family acid phosphatase [Woeseiaceae bacterium]|nr:HAD family acid phosphatase [Woeseiaceae bacterium]
MKRTLAVRLLPGLIASTLAACAGQPGPGTDSGTDLGLRWVRDAAEWQALSLQVYAAASEDLPRFLNDRSWSALPGQRDAAELPPAIIFDVDDTLVSNVDFQIALEPPFRNSKFDDWNATYEARPVPGAAKFVQLAIDAGVEVFFVTNRPCEARPGVERFCPQQETTIHDLIETGIPANADRVMMAAEQADWTSEKRVRRDLIARDYRVIMLFGDDLADFIPCARKSVVPPCTEPATKALREATTDAHANYWGDGWYILPNPMYGSWTSVE